MPRGPGKGKPAGDPSPTDCSVLDSAPAVGATDRRVRQGVPRGVVGGWVRVWG